MMLAEVDVVTSKGVKAYYAFKGSRSGQARSVMVLPTLWDAGRGILLRYMRKAFGFDFFYGSCSSIFRCSSCFLPTAVFLSPST
jgi:hypothetical protein